MLAKQQVLTFERLHWRTLVVSVEEVVQSLETFHCREETPDASLKEKPLTTSQIGSRKVQSDEKSEHPDDTYYLPYGAITLSANCLNRCYLAAFLIGSFLSVFCICSYAESRMIHQSLLWLGLVPAESFCLPISVVLHNPSFQFKSFAGVCLKSA
jgi:hypothetical protein